MRDYIYFEILSGDLLDRVKKHIAERRRVEEEAAALCEKYGANRYVRSGIDGTIIGLIFNHGESHPDFKNPNRNGVSFPKKKSSAANEINGLRGYDFRGYNLAKEIGFPPRVSYTMPPDENGFVGEGWRSSSTGMNSGCQFLYLSDDGPYVLAVSDIQPIIDRYEAEGRIVDENVKNWKPEFPGTRRLLKEEWDLMVAQQYRLRSAIRPVRRHLQSFENTDLSAKAAKD